MTMASQFHRPDGSYFLSHSVGLLPHGYQSALEATMFAPWRAGNGAWDDWLATIAGFRTALGRFLHADPKMICPQSNLSSALTKIIFSRPPSPGHEVVLLSEQDFPSIGFVLQQATKAGWRVEFLPREADLADPQTWLAAMDSNVGLVHVTHVYSNTSLQTPVSKIVRAARARGITSIVDIAQSAGAVPVDVQEWGADFVIGSCVKYLCGGPGAGYLIANRETIEHFIPQDVGWFSHAAPFDFDIHNFQYAEDAAKFWGGTPSVLPYAMAKFSIEHLLEIGPDTIHNHNQAMLSNLLAGLDPAYIHSATSPDSRGCGLLYGPPDIEASTARLRQAGVRHDRRGESLRLSVHLYTTEEEVRTALRAITG